MKNLFTSEQVTQGHPDRLADQLSDTVLDFCLKEDKESKVACEVMVKDRYIVFGGEITTKANLTYDVLKEISIKTLTDIGYDWDPIVINLLGKQSPQINSGVVKGNDILGAGDQGIIFGYATKETNSGHKLSFHICNEIIEQYDKIRYSNDGEYLGPDAKTQVTIEYFDGKPSINTIVLSASLKNSEEEFKETKQRLIKEIILPVINKYSYSNDFKILINPAGYWSYEFSGPIGDAGVTGRKIVCDQYGGAAPVGGGAFSGKDPSKVDRSAAYMARHISKKVLNNFDVNECLIQLSYAIGVAEPVSIVVTTNKPKYNEDILNYINKSFDLTPSGIIKYLDLLNISYVDCAKYGHMSKCNFNWEII